MGKVIAFLGAAGAGKTTAATHVVKIGPKLTPRVEMRRHNFAKPIKEMLKGLAFGAGMDKTEANRITTDPILKETQIPQLGNFTPRFLLQSIGTEWGRDIVHEDFWVMLQMNKVNTALQKGYGVVYDDLRFDNEANFVRAFGGAVVGIKGRTADIETKAHRSETETPEPDFWLDNSKDEEHLFAQVDEVIAKYLQE